MPTVQIDQEATLLGTTNSGLSEIQQQRFSELDHKRQAETLSVAEHQELLGLIDEMEAHNVKRVILNMVQSRQLTLAKAAKFANMDLSSFIELLGASGIDAVDYPPEELERELEDALAACDHS